MLDTAVIDLGLLPHIFWSLTLVDFYRLVLNFYLKEAREWDRTRNVIAIIHNTNVEKKHQKKVNILMPMWIDKLEKIQKINKFKSDQEKAKLFKLPKK